jgi:hypothetical protein
MISRFSFAIDVNEWGFNDLRADRIAAMKRHPEIVRLQASPVWDERADDDDHPQAPDPAKAEA